MVKAAVFMVMTVFSSTLPCFFGTLSAASRLEFSGWKKVQKESEAAIVQIIAHGAEAHPLKPYYKESSEGRGSGTLIKESNGVGYILTSYHVVENAVKVDVLMPLLRGKQTLEADIVGVCPDYDIALLQLKPAVRADLLKEYGELPALPLGDSESVDRSDELLGLGFPLGEESLKSVTGVVSGYEHIQAHNKLRIHSSYTIQVSTPLNPGSSGGPALNKEGEVIGINLGAAIEAQSVGYIVPINYYKLLAQQLKEGGLLRKPTFGAQGCRARGDELALYLGNPTPAGCYVTHVFKDGLAASLGLQEGDMVYTINGLKVDAYGCVKMSFSKDRLSLTDYLSSLPLGNILELEMYRKGQLIAVTGQLTLTPPCAIRWHYFPYDPIEYEIVGGLLIQELSLNIIALFNHTTLGDSMPDVRARLSFYKEEAMQEKSVLVVTHIFPSSTAYNARSFGVGSILAQVNGQPVPTLQELRAVVQRPLDKGCLVCKDDENHLLVLPVATIVKDEPRLSQSFGYPGTPVMQILMEQEQTKRAL